MLLDPFNSYLSSQEIYKYNNFSRILQELYYQKNRKEYFTFVQRERNVRAYYHSLCPEWQYVILALQSWGSNIVETLCCALGMKLILKELYIQVFEI